MICTTCGSRYVPLQHIYFVKKKELKPRKEYEDSHEEVAREVYESNKHGYCGCQNSAFR